jgi:cell division protein FtsI (penicillin-binding protein 3)
MHRDKKDSYFYDRKLVMVVFLFLFSLFSLLIFQFYKIQIIDGAKWQRLGNKQHCMMVVEPCSRGVFYSNTTVKLGHPEKEQPLVLDIPRFHLYADPKSIEEKYREEIIFNIKKICEISFEGGVKIKNHLEKKNRCRRLIMWITPSQKETLTNWWQPYARQHKIPSNALFCIQDYKRVYPFGKLLGQVLHSIHNERAPRENICFPTGGLEFSLNNYLSGRDGKRVIMRSPKQHLDVGKILQEPIHGADVYLTVNHHLQAIAEEEIEKAVKNAGAKSGWAVMMDPYTGEILSLAQYPFFYPENYKDYFNDKTKEEDTRVKAIMDPYEPGSVMKAITVAIGLQANKELEQMNRLPLFSPSEKIAAGSAKFPGRTKLLKDLQNYRYLNMNMAIQKSSNVYVGKIVQRIVETLGDEWYRNALQNIFGFGLKTGIELPAESNATIPTIGKKHPSGKLEWSKATPYSIAMGHNILATSIQVLRAYAILANGGFNVHPTLVRKIVSKKGEVLVGVPQPSPKRILDPSIVEQVVKAMRFTTKPGGTGIRANILGYTEAGKTGTSEKVINGKYSIKNHISTFVGMAPATNPRFVLLIAIDEPEWKYIPGVGKNQMGSVCAAPVFREIGERTLQYLGISPDDEKNNAWNIEVKALQALYEQWNR